MVGKSSTTLLRRISNFVWTLLKAWARFFCILSVGHVVFQYVFSGDYPLELTFRYFASIFITGVTSVALVIYTGYCFNELFKMVYKIRK